ncbi:MAG: sulfotransferase domain-containing protein [Phycisphaerales bacterium]|nr:MAG: sulfotransferase domain-containing protein [Phycisphaerales bacterium]
MTVTKRLESLARALLPPAGARLAKRWAVHGRYWAQARACRRGFREYGDRYPQKVLFVAGLPKSGTTWLEKMLASYPGFYELLIPDVAAHELRTGGSHDYDLPADIFSRFRDMLVLTKMHVHGSPHNLRLLKQAGVKYVVLHRDLRDVSVSHYFYVRQTPWHPEYPIYRDLPMEDALAVYADRTLLDYVQWVRGWHERLDQELGLEIRYEEMLADAGEVLTRVAEHFQLDSSPETVGRIVDIHSFKRLSRGRDRGQQSKKSFFRKGIAGDWKNHFTPAVTDKFKAAIGEFLVEYGYEKDLSW